MIKMSLLRRFSCGGNIGAEVIFEEWNTEIQRTYCIRIRTRGGIYYEIWPEPKEVPEGALYIPTRVLIRTLYHSYE